ncbi:hypothetical protein GH714_029294 [Hevea brasiliensis]|uniref:Uncharacterized protein n=1 Tax=Hevea brasiliensis TaxID=3981 RepID=A0A6A6K989_HEVBR|nr:hypothetical protein GH714_029294 [Hevea brasiliensis]
MCCCFVHLKGIRWVVGSGLIVIYSEDPWKPNEYTFKAIMNLNANPITRQEGLICLDGYPSGSLFSPDFGGKPSSYKRLRGLWSFCHRPSLSTSADLPRFTSMAVLSMLLMGYCYGCVLSRFCMDLFCLDETRPCMLIVLIEATVRKLVRR